MAQSTWSYLQNPFENVSKRNKKNMFLMATDHFDKLSAQSSDATIAALYNYGKPFFDDFKAQYSKTQNDNAIYQMHTLRVQKLLINLQSTLIRQWDTKIQIVIDKKTPEYLSILPNGRLPFQTGAIEFRINNVKALANQLESYPLLAALRAEIDNFHAQLLQLRIEQQGAEYLAQNNLVFLEKTRANLAQAMHSILAGLTQYYIGNLGAVESFYELKYLRQKVRKRSKPEVNKAM